MIAPISRLLLLSITFIALAIVNPSNGFAEDEATSVREAATEAKIVMRAEAPSMIIDPEANAFRFFIDGKEVARIDQGGLHVRDDVTYGGAITDGGSAAFDERAVEKGAAQ